MAGLLDMLNHLLGAWVAAQPGGGAWQIREVKLDEQGGVMVARVDRGAAQGEIVLRLRADPPQGGAQTLHVTVERMPEQLPGALEPFRHMLETARVSVELQLDPSKTP